MTAKTPTSKPRIGPPSIREYIAGNRFDGTVIRDREKCNKHRANAGLEPLPPLETYAASQVVHEPGLLQKAANFTSALTKHVAGGMKKASQEQIDARLAICEACPLYNATKKICTKCGCGCSGSAGFMNKLAWASSVCPHPDGQRWGAIETV